MKKPCFLHTFNFILIVFFWILSNDVYAKKNYYEGYIINSQGDTIHGLVKDRDSGPYSDLYIKIKFIEEGKKRAKRFSASQILEYGYSGNVFRSVRFREESSMFQFRYYTDLKSPYTFLRVVSETDDLVYYENEFVYDDNFVIDSFPLLHIPGSNEMVRVTQGVLGLKWKRLLEYFAACPELVKVLKNKSLNTAIGIFDFYNVHCKGK
jgi:hypothetical protein